MRLDYNSAESLAPVLEALLFASDEPLSAQTLRALILGEETPRTDVNDPLPGAEVAAGPTPDQLSDDSDEAGSESAAPGEKKERRKRKSPIELTVIHDAVGILNAQYKDTSRGFRIVEIAGGYQFATRGEYAEYVARMFKDKSRRRLSSAALESLAIIAYKQPVSKMDIENIRGVNCDEVLKSLLEKNLVTITGRSEAVGRPLLYGTTTDFLRHFGLPALTDLPKPREIEELLKEEATKATTLEEAANEFSPQADDNMTVDALLAGVKSGAISADDLTASTEIFSNASINASGNETTSLTNESSPDERESDANDRAGIELDVEAMTSLERNVDDDVANAFGRDAESDDTTELVEEPIQLNGNEQS